MTSTSHPTFRHASIRSRSALATPTLVAFVASLFVLPATTGCGPGNVIAKNKSIGDVDDQTSTCKVAKDPLNPMIVEWPATSKVNLDRTSKSGLVVVSYAGCTLKILQGCRAKGDYEYTGVTPARDKIDIGSQDDLYARLPLGALSLKGELAQGATLRLDYIAVGQRVAADAPKGLEGNCEGATHYVRTITLGAYSLDRMAKAKAGAGVEFNGAGIGGERKESDERLNFSGDVDGCSGTAPSSEEDATKAGCGAPLQLDLAPLQITDGSVVSAGFGQGLGSLTSGPTEMAGLDAVGATSLKDVDADYLQLLQNAKRADRDVKMKPIEKANVWGALASYEGNNPTKKLAEERRDAWEKTAADLDKLKNQYLSDRTKLDKLLKLDEDIVSKDKKAAYKEEFAQVYTPWEPQLEIALGQAVPMTGDANRDTNQPSEEQLGTFRIEAEGGVDFQKLDYELKTESEATLYDADHDGTAFKGSHTGIGGFGGLALTLPQIPIPGLGLSLIGRFAGGGDVSRVTVDAGLKLLTKSGLIGGLYLGYAKLIAAKDQTKCSAASEGLCESQIQRIADSSAGGFDVRLDIGYEFLIGKLFTLSINGGLGYVVIPFGEVPVTANAMGGSTTGASDIASGVSATLSLGFGFRL